MEINQENTNQQNEEKKYEYTQMKMFDEQELNQIQKDLSSNQDSSNLADVENKANETVEEEPKNDEEEIASDNKSEDKSDENLQDDNLDLSKIDNRTDAEEFLETKGLEYFEFQKEFDETGMISKESREKLLKSGIPEEFVDNFIEGQKARVNAEMDEISKCVGGRNNMDTIIEWAGKNLTEEEIISINSVHDKNLMKIILKELRTRMEEKDGIIPNYTKGDSGSTVEDVFRSRAEMFEAINNPKYRRDEAYRLDIQKKVAASMRAGIDLGI